MKVDQYRVLKAKEYSFIVPAGTDLGDFDEPYKGWINTLYPYVLELQDVEIESIVLGQDMATVLEFIDRDGIVVSLLKPFPSDDEKNENAID